MSTEYTVPQVITVLTGHTSPETAYVVADYPYGFRLRTSIRYWVESKKGQGQRFVSQTLNPKTGKWNAPKASIYSLIVGMYLDEVGHVQHTGISGYSSADEIETFGQTFAAVIESSSYAKSSYEYAQAAKRAASRVKWTVTTVTAENENEPHQTIEQQAHMMHQLTIQELINPSR